MKYDKIMAGGNLENIVSRLNGCRLLLCSLTGIAEVSSMRPEVLQSVADLLESICRDFQADIDGAEDYIGKGGGSVSREQLMESITRLLNEAGDRELDLVYRFVLHLV